MFASGLRIKVVARSSLKVLNLRVPSKPDKTFFVIYFFTENFSRQFRDKMCGVPKYLGDYEILKLRIQTLLL